MSVETLAALIDRRDRLRRKRPDDAPEVGALLQRIAMHPEASSHADFPRMLMDLAEWNANTGRFDDAIEVLERAIDAGLEAATDPRCELADYHLRAGRAAMAAAIFANVRRDVPGDVWLYNAAGLAYSAVGDDETAVGWLTDGFELAIHGDDSEHLVAQLADMRAASRRRLGLDAPDELERCADAFLRGRRASTLTPLPTSTEMHAPNDTGGF